MQDFLTGSIAMVLVASVVHMVLSFAVMVSKRSSVVPETTVEVEELIEWSELPITVEKPVTGYSGRISTDVLEEDVLEGDIEVTEAVENWQEILFGTKTLVEADFSEDSEEIPDYFEAEPLDASLFPLEVAYAPKAIASDAVLVVKEKPLTVKEMRAMLKGTKGVSKMTKAQLEVLING
jgi:hypothetical protein